MIAHRDITPGNVLVTVDGRAVLIDFGLVAGAVARRETASNVVKATWRYAAPEQLDGGAVSSAFDGYALGALLYLMLTGERPFSGCNDPDEILHAKKTQVLSCPGLPDELQSLIRDSMAVDPASRPAMPGEFKQRVESLQPAPKLEVVEVVLGAIIEVEREDRRLAAEKKLPLSAEQRGEDITDPVQTDDITEVGEIYRASDRGQAPKRPFFGLVLLVLLIAFLLARNL